MRAIGVQIYFLSNGFLALLCRARVVPIAELLNISLNFFFYIIERDGPSSDKPTLNFLFMVQSSIKSVALMMTAYQLSPGGESLACETTLILAVTILYWVCHH